MPERAGVSERTVQDQAGHERFAITGSACGGRSTLEMRRDAVARLVYAKDREGLFARIVREPVLLDIAANAAYYYWVDYRG